MLLGVLKMVDHFRHELVNEAKSDLDGKALVLILILALVLGKVLFRAADEQLELIAALDQEGVERGDLLLLQELVDEFGILRGHVD